MNRHILLGVLALGVLAVGREACGVFPGLQMVMHADVVTAAGPKKVYRIYAVFTDGADRLTAWGGSPQQAINLHTVGCVPGSFYQAPGGSNRAPSARDIAFNPDVQWDTFATIGVNVADQGDPFDQTMLSPGFPTFINGGTYSTTGVVFAFAASPQARADFAGDGDPALRVLMMQLTVGPDAAPDGFITTLTWVSPNGTNNNPMGPHYFAPIEPPGQCCVPEGYCITTSGPACSFTWNGLFSYQCPPCDVCELTCVPDIVPHPGNGVVDVADLLAVINAWGTQLTLKVPADVSPPHGNWVVNVDDLLVVINGWGPCPRDKPGG